MYNTYVIENQSSFKIYIGYTADLSERLERHNNLSPNKKTSFTSINKGEWIVIYIEELSTLKEARAREKQLKSSRGRSFLKQFRHTVDKQITGQ